MRSSVDLWEAVSTQPWKTLTYIFTSFSVIFTLVRGLTYFIPAIKLEGIGPLAMAISVSIFYGLIKIWKPSQIEIPVANCDTVIEIIFGDLFAQSGIRVIAVSEFFDSQLGVPVSGKSLHGIFLQKCFGGHPESFDKQIHEQLKNINGREVEK